MKKAWGFVLLAFGFFIIRQLGFVYPQVLSGGIMLIAGGIILLAFSRPQLAPAALSLFIPVVATIIEMTLGKFTQFERVVFLYSSLLGLGLACAGTWSYPKELFRFPRKIWVVAAALLSGVALGGLSVMAMPVSSMPISHRCAVIFWLCIPIFAFAEELVFRRLLYGELKKAVGIAPALAISAIVFGALHTGASISTFVMSYGISFVMTWIYEQEENTLVSTLGNVVMKVTFVMLLISTRPGIITPLP